MTATDDENGEPDDGNDGSAPVCGDAVDAPETWIDGVEDVGPPLSPPWRKSHPVVTSAQMAIARRNITYTTPHRTRPFHPLPSGATESK